MAKHSNRLELLRKDASAPNSVLLATGRHHVLSLLNPKAQFVEFDDVFFSYNSTALLPETRDHTPPTNADGEPITGLNLCMAVLQYSEQFANDKPLLVLGHTDTVGSDDENVLLSQLRAQVVYGLVAGDRQAFMDAVDAPHIQDKQTKANRLVPDKNFILDWIADYTDWPCSLAENYNSHWAATEKFQSHYNDHGAAFGGSATLDVDGDFGPQTWGAVFDIYQDHIARTLEITHDELDQRQAALAWAADQTKHAGCGEFHPIDQVGIDGVRSASNRRVEVTFFDRSEIPQLECFAGGCAKQECALYDILQFRRDPLPISWKAVWKVGWDRPADPARMDEPRDIVLAAPKLADGTEVTFHVFQEVDGQRIEVAQLSALAENQGARAQFGAWFSPAAVTVDNQLLAADQEFPVVRFHVSALADGRTVEGRRPLIYGDTLEAQVDHELVDGDHVEPSECLIHSPWGTKQAQIDELGTILVERLPPGGVMITVDGDPYYPV